MSQTVNCGACGRILKPGLRTACCIAVDAARLQAERDALLAACEAALEHIDDSQGTVPSSEESGTDFFDGEAGTDARLLMEDAVRKARRP